MTSDNTLPQELQDCLMGTEEWTAEDLALAWTRAAGADPLGAIAPPDAARIRRIKARLPMGLRRATPRAGLAAAAIVALLIAAGLYLWQRPVTLAAPAGAATAAELPDGSQVLLSGDAQLTYGRRASRHVRLDGEAFFTVRSTGAPFVVETFNATVTVLGTSFRVKARRDIATHVYVKTGKVQVAALFDEEQTIELAGGEAARIGSEGEGPLALDALAPEPPFIFIKQPLDAMFDAIEERFGIQIIADEEIRGHVHNFKHDVLSAEQLLGDLCQSVTALNLRYRAIAGGFEVFEE